MQQDAVERLVAWYRIGSSLGALIALIVANVIPLLGVLFLGWSVWNILIIYWLENGIVGAFNILKMARAEGTSADPGPALMINGQPASSMSKIRPDAVLRHALRHLLVRPRDLRVHAAGLRRILSPGAADEMTIEPGSILVAGFALAVSHGLSFWWNYLRGGEYRRATAASLMFAPYRRLIVLHLTIIFGGMAIMFTGAPAAAVAILVLVKTVLDVGLHLAEHRGSTPLSAIA